MVEGCLPPPPGGDAPVQPLRPVAMAEDGRQPHKTEEHRERWVRFYAKVRPVLTPDVAQRVIQARAGGGRRAKR